MALPQGREEYYLGLFQQAEANQDLQALNNLRSQYLAEDGAMTPTPTAPVTGQQAFRMNQPPAEDPLFGRYFHGEFTHSFSTHGGHR